MRPVLTLLACEAFGKPAEKSLESAFGIELFHNFSLIHDDIMDDAPLRRGKQTVHEKWSLNIGILSGDVVFAESFKSIAQVEDSLLRRVMDLFTQTSIEVCEGQQWDMDFELRQDVSEEEYIQMIQYKTSVLLGAALQIGAWIGGADEIGAKAAYAFGLNMGTAFQIKDDLLDAFGNPEKFGKQVGGDILANKKTILLIHALEHANDEQLSELQGWMSSDQNPEAKVKGVKALYEAIGSVKHAEATMEAYFERALTSLSQCKEHGANVLELEKFAQYLYHRDH